MLRSIKQLMLAGSVAMSLLALNAPARADIIPQLNSLPTPVVGGFLWEYNADLTPAQFLAAGDFFTIYDFAGFVPMSNVQPVNWIFSSALVGVTPAGLTVADNAGVPNLTWTYTGPTTGNGPIDLGLFKAISTFNTQRLGGYAAMAHLHHPGFIDHATGTMNKGITIVPVVPEPGTMALLGLGAAPLIGRLRRRNRKA
jgi:hypothetical protein